MKEKPHKLRQKDTDTHWGKKNKLLYLQVTKIISKFISTYAVSCASVHDYQELEALIDSQGYSVDWCGLTTEVHEEGVGSHPLTDVGKLDKDIDCAVSFRGVYL